jgi:signal transduction protein with GAF and PtsI domain
MDDAYAISQDLIRERDVVILERDALASQLLDVQRDCNAAVRARDAAKESAIAARSHAAAVTRAMGIVRNSMAQVFESVKEMEHWLAKHSEEISADLDSDLVLGEDCDLGLHHSKKSELEGPQIRKAPKGRFDYINPND